MKTETIDTRVIQAIEAAVPLSVQERTSLLGLGSEGEGKPDRPRAAVLEAVLVRMVAAKTLWCYHEVNYEMLDSEIVFSHDKAMLLSRLARLRAVVAESDVIDEGPTGLTVADTDHHDMVGFEVSIFEVGANGATIKPAKDHWACHPNHPPEDWSYEVASGDTRLGYRDWVQACIKAGS